MASVHLRFFVELRGLNTREMKEPSILANLRDKEGKFVCY